MDEAFACERNPTESSDGSQQDSSINRVSKDIRGGQEEDEAQRKKNICNSLFND
jgi:hypothetical protein